MLDRKRNRKVALLLLATMSLMGCGGSPPVEMTNAPRRAVAPQPARDANGNILTTQAVLPEGTEFTVQTVDFLTSQTAAEGDPIKLEVESNVVVNGAIAIAAGSTVKGVISAANKAGRVGKSGNISLRIEQAQTVDGQPVKLRASKTKMEDDKLGSTVALAVVLSPLFLLRKGNDVAYQPGTRITVYTNERLDVKAWRQ